MDAAKHAHALAAGTDLVYKLALKNNVEVNFKFGLGAKFTLSLVVGLLPLCWHLTHLKLILLHAVLRCWEH